MMRKSIFDSLQFWSIFVVVAMSIIVQVKSYGALEQRVDSTIFENNKLSTEINDLRKEIKCANESMREISGYLRGYGLRIIEDKQ